MHVKNWDTRKIWSSAYFIGLYFIILYYFYCSYVFDKNLLEINYYVPHKLFLISYPFWLFLYIRSSWRVRVIDFFVLPIFVVNWFFCAVLFGSTGVIGLLIEPGIISLLILAYYFLKFILKERYMGSFSPGIILIFLSIIYYTTHYFLRIYCTLSD